jgi:hypothetical protein
MAVTRTVAGASVLGPPAAEFVEGDVAVAVEVDQAEADPHLLLGHAGLEVLEQLEELGVVDPVVPVGVAEREVLAEFLLMAL